MVTLDQEGLFNSGPPGEQFRSLIELSNKSKVNLLTKTLFLYTFSSTICFSSRLFCEAKASNQKDIMATSSDSKQLPDEVDGNSKVVPAGTEKHKKKGLFGKATKSESKTKGKETKKDSKGKEETPKDETKDKKSDKAESKKEGTTTLICIMTFIIINKGRTIRKVMGRGGGGVGQNQKKFIPKKN